MPAAPNPIELAQRVMDKLGVRPSNPRYNGATELARALGWSDARMQSRYRKWASGKSTPDYYETWDMLNALGWIRQDESPIEVAEDLVRRLDAGEQHPKKDLERVAAQVDRLVVSLPRLAGRLREGVQADRPAR